MNDTNQNGNIPLGRGAQSTTKGPIIPKSPTDALRPEKVPQPPKRSRNARSQLVIFLNFIMTLVVAICVVAIAAFYYAISAYQATGPLAIATNFKVNAGAGISEISESLQANSMISDARIFRYVTATYLKSGQTLKAGEYQISAGASMKDIAALLESGKSILHPVPVPEGLTVKQVFQRLQEQAMLSGELPSALPREGSLRPDTYKVSSGMRRDELLSQMIAAQDKLVNQIWEKRDPGLPIKTIEEFVTLASIVEKETGKDDERAHVASVFINRLNKGMRLQSDPTIIYGLFGGDGKPADRPIYQSDLQKPTEYNTYLIKALPPGPIANPGRAALEAVANPWRTDDLYFVADGTGGHVFAKTLDEHNANVRRWRKLEAERGANPNEIVDGQPGSEAPAVAPKKN